MKRRILLCRLHVLSLILLSATTFAQTPLPGIELERLELNPGAEGSLVVSLGQLLPSGHYRATVAMQYAHDPLLFERDGESFRIVGSRATTHLAVAYSVTDWLQFGLQLPVVAFQSGSDLTGENITRPASFALGTPSASARVGILTQDNEGGVDLALEMGVGLPIGSREGLTRDGALRLAPRLMVGRHFGFLRGGLEVGFLSRPQQALTQRPGILVDEVGNELRIGAALATTGRRLRWELNVRGMVPLTAQPGAVELLPGARYLVKPTFELFALAGMGVGSAPGTPLFRLMVGGAFGDVTPERGPGESSVNCEPGLAHTIEECPEMDEDHDGVRNGLDRCPLVPGTLERNGCEKMDTDSDGLEDALDMCPVEPGPASAQGCPLRDTDKDGTEDDSDTCPNEAGPPENQGCPVRDADKDGIDNDKDACPNEAGPIERDGCPETDTDKDGVPNRIDSCANEAGPYDNLGCPQHIYPLVVLHATRLETRGRVYFEPAQTRVSSRSFAVLDWVAQVILEHPEFPLIAVGAHTDDRGLPEANRQLSQGRAAAVRQYLIGKKVPPERLAAYGYGQDRPIDSNLTSVGRENNRRVEFVIVDPQAEKPAGPTRESGSGVTR
ncbi:OmpA family protein [Corallococcus sp. bb12-1]|uniref:OmpA family protein n=1 Tax=Corallococcus sp. bb12-1 TaxID=2996784 RepID=UPI0022708919|nr:OmpA family protein [Corallococcus sp. bb12-1]MCY1042242.1 OmpA family protein [Corallococcus sp. bb12-1]